MLELIAKNANAWIGLLVVVLGAAWTLWVYTRNNRVKTAEFLLQLEGEYAKHQNTFLSLETQQDYEARFKWALIKCTRNPADPLSDVESRNISQVEAALRFLYVGLAIKQLELDAGYCEWLNAYYLRKLTACEDLSRYIEMYWPSLFYWSQLAGRPAPSRLLIYAKQIPGRWRCYWYGVDDFHRRRLFVRKGDGP